TDFQAAVRQSPDLIPAWRNLGRACQILGDRDASATPCAEDAWRRVLRAQPGDTEALASLAMVYEWQGKFQDSLGVISQMSPDEQKKASVAALRCADLAGLRKTAEARETAVALAQEDFSEEDIAAILPVLGSTRSNDVIVTLVEPLDKRGKAS